MDGFIKAKIVTGGGVDSTTGASVPVNSTWGENVECVYNANTLSNKGVYKDGSFKNASYTITTDDMDFYSTIVLLIDSRGNTVCEKPVLSLEICESIQKVKIVI